MGTYGFEDCDKAIEKIQELKKNQSNCHIIICTIDFDNDKESRKITTPEEGCVLVRKSRTIIFDDDFYIPHMQLYSHLQTDLENIIKRGTMHDIIFSGEK